MIPGLAMFTARAEPLATWMTGLEVAFFKVRAPGRAGVFRCVVLLQSRVFSFVCFHSRCRPTFHCRPPCGQHKVAGASSSSVSSGASGYNLNHFFGGIFSCMWPSVVREAVVV